MSSEGRHYPAAYQEPTKQANLSPEPIKMSFIQAARKWPKVVVFSLALTSAILLSGYDQVVVGTVSAMPEFQKFFGRQLTDGTWIIPSVWLALWNVAGPVGTMPGAVVGGIVQDRFGRRLALAFGSSLSAIAVAICYVSDLPSDTQSRCVVFFAGKFFQGFSLGLVMCITQTYLSEILPTSLRGSILAFFPTFTLLGQLVGAVVVFMALNLEGPISYRVCFASQWPFSVVPFLVALILPESPTWLIRRNRIEDAIKAQRRLTKKTKPTDGGNAAIISPDQVEPQDPTPEQIILRLRQSIQLEAISSRSSRARYTDCFIQPSNRRRTMIVIFANLLPLLFGLTLLANASYFMQVVGMSADNSIRFLILGIALGLLSNIASIFVLDSVGRRPLIMHSLAITAVLWTGMGIAGSISTTSPAMIWYTAITMMVIIVVCGMGVWPASWVVASETSSLKLRAKTQGIAWFSSGAATAVFGIILPYIFNKDEGNLRAKTGFVFTGLSLVGWLGTWLWVPEMRGRDSREIDWMFGRALDAKEFERTAVPVDMELKLDMNADDVAVEDDDDIVVEEPVSAPVRPSKGWKARRHTQSP